MLREVSLFLAKHDNVVSVIARTQEELNDLVLSAGELADRIHPIAVDYLDDYVLRKQLRKAIAKHGPVTLAVNWMQTEALESAYSVAEILNKTSPVCRFFQVLPGTDINDQRLKPFFEGPFEGLDRVLYRQIVLGFVAEKGMSRWLSNEEISEGAISALRNDTKVAVIGSVEPYEDRPQTA